MTLRETKVLAVSVVYYYYTFLFNTVTTWLSVSSNHASKVFGSEMKARTIHFNQLNILPVTHIMITIMHFKHP